MRIKKRSIIIGHSQKLNVALRFGRPSHQASASIHWKPHDFLTATQYTLACYSYVVLGSAGLVCCCFVFHNGSWRAECSSFPGTLHNCIGGNLHQNLRNLPCLEPCSHRMHCTFICELHSKSMERCKLTLHRVSGIGVGVLARQALRILAKKPSTLSRVDAWRRHSIQNNWTFKRICV